MKNKTVLLIILSIVVLGAVAAGILLTRKPVADTGLANPAAVFCGEQGGKSEIVTAQDGSQGGRCVFSDGRSCDEWDFYRTKECK